MAPPGDQGGYLPGAGAQLPLQCCSKRPSRRRLRRAAAGGGGGGDDDDDAAVSPARSEPWRGAADSDRHGDSFKDTGGL